jgi:hypothetical protein
MDRVEEIRYVDRWQKKFVADEMESGVSGRRRWV